VSGTEAFRKAETGRSGCSTDISNLPGGGGWSVVESSAICLTGKRSSFCSGWTVLDSTCPNCQHSTRRRCRISSTFSFPGFTFSSPISGARVRESLGTSTAPRRERMGMHQHHGPVADEWLAGQDHSSEHLFPDRRHCHRHVAIAASSVFSRHMFPAIQATNGAMMNQTGVRFIKATRHHQAAQPVNHLSRWLPIHEEMQN